jgi:ATP-dependent Lon protease
MKTIQEELGGVSQEEEMERWQNQNQEMGREKNEFQELSSNPQAPDFGIQRNYLSFY